MYKEAETGMRGGIWTCKRTLRTMELSGHSMKGNRVDPGTASLRVLFFFLSSGIQQSRAEQSVFFWLGMMETVNR